MIRAAIGGLLGGLALFFIGFVFWGTPLAHIAVSSTDDQTSANVQLALAQGLTKTGTGAYVIPDPNSSGGTTLYGKGPVAMVQFNAHGFPVNDTGGMIAGLVLALAVGVMIAFALRALSPALGDFRSRATAVLLFAGGATLWTDIGQPVFNHAPWVYFVYLGISNFVGLAAAGLIVARWFLPKNAAAL